MRVCRYEVNPDVVAQVEEAGMHFVGRDETGERMEILELVNNPADHPYYVAAQYHPEYKSRCVVPQSAVLHRVQEQVRSTTQCKSRCAVPQSARAGAQYHPEHKSRCLRHLPTHFTIRCARHIHSTSIVLMRVLFEFCPGCL